MKHFLYLRGNPGVGKITVARILERDLGWRVFWFHDLKNAVFNIVQEHRIPRLMDEVTAPVICHLLDKGQDVIYVRPSPDRETVEAIGSILKSYPEYAFHPVRLTASYDTLLQRVSERDDPYRISRKQDLDEYLARKTKEVDGEVVINTDRLSPGEVAKEIAKRLS